MPYRQYQILQEDESWTAVAHGWEVWKFDPYYDDDGNRHWWYIVLGYKGPTQVSRRVADLLYSN